MDHFIDQIEIKNFKSIRELTLTGFKRINLFIGRPNVGKSNLLEALSLFALPYVWFGSKDIRDILRFNSINEIFYEGNINGNILITVEKNREDGSSCHVQYSKDRSEIIMYVQQPYRHSDQELANRYRDDIRFNIFVYFVSSNKMRSGYDKVKRGANIYSGEIKPYKYDQSINYKENKLSFLQPPFGNNLLYILQLYSELRQLYTQWFKQYGLRLVLDMASQSLKVQRDKNEDEVFQLPYSSVADTLQRIIFYKTAIASNQNSVLLFEEPEAHAYPPYISEFTQEVIGSKTNQTFIVTHSPLIVNDMLDNAIDDLAIFIVDFKDGQTVSRPLTQEELHEVRKFGIDLFFNGEAYPV